MFDMMQNVMENSWISWSKGDIFWLAETDQVKCNSERSCFFLFSQEISIYITDELSVTKPSVLKTEKIGRDEEGNVVTIAVEATPNFTDVGGVLCPG